MAKKQEPKKVSLTAYLNTKPISQRDKFVIEKTLQYEEDMTIEDWEKKVKTIKGLNI